MFLVIEIDVCHCPHLFQQTNCQSWTLQGEQVLHPGRALPSLQQQLQGPGFRFQVQLSPVSCCNGAASHRRGTGSSRVSHGRLQHVTRCRQCHSLLPPPAAAQTPRNACFISHQAHQNKATLILRVMRIGYAAFAALTERKAAAKPSPRLQSGDMGQAFLLRTGHAATTKEPAVTAGRGGDGGLRLSSAWATASPG